MLSSEENMAKKQLPPQKRKEILIYFYQHGWKDTVAQYGVGKSTLYNWNNAFKLRGEQGLTPLSRRPLKLAKKRINAQIYLFIWRYYQSKPQAPFSAAVRYLKAKGAGEWSVMTVWRAVKRPQPVFFLSDFALNVPFVWIKPD